MVIAQQIEHLQQGLVRQAFAVTAIAGKQLEQTLQCRFVLLARQLLYRQLIGCFVILRVLRQARFQVSDLRQVGRLTQERQLRLGPGQRGLVLVALHRVQHRLGFVQLATLGQATAIKDQCLGVAVVFAQQFLQDRFGITDPTFGKQRFGLLKRIGGRWRWHLHMGFEQFAHRRFRLGTGETVHWLAVLEQHHGRQATDAKAGDDILLGIAVDLGQQQFALIALGDLLQHRHQRLAGRAPLGPEVHQHRLVERILDHRLVEISGSGVEDVRGGLSHRNLGKRGMEPL